jgi:uncharacterized protein YjhX (UPF0386 family)
MGRLINKILRLALSGAAMRSGHLQAEAARISASDRAGFYYRSCELRFAEKLDCIPDSQSSHGCPYSAGRLSRK